MLKPTKRRIFALLAPRDFGEPLLVSLMLRPFFQVYRPHMQAIELIQRFLTVSREKLDAIKTFQDAHGFTLEFVLDAVARLKSIDTLTGKEKYDLVMTAVGWLMDYFIGVITLPWYLRWLLWLTKPDVRAKVMSAADRLLEAFYAHIK